MRVMTPPDQMIATEYVVSVMPFVVRRQVRWSECDPAGVVFTGVFPNYVISAVQLLREHLFGSWGDRLKASGAGAPAKAISLEFHRMLEPGTRFDMTVLVPDVNEKTVRYDVRAELENGDAVFDAQLTSIFITPGNRPRSQPIPAEIRSIFEGYRRQSN